MNIEGLGVLFDQQGPPQGTGPMTGRRMGIRGLGMTAPAVGGFSAEELKKLYDDLAARVISARGAYIKLKAKGYTKIPGYFWGVGRMMRHVAQAYYLLTGKRLAAVPGVAEIAPAIERIAAAIAPPKRPPVIPAIAPPVVAKKPPYAALGIGALILAGLGWLAFGGKRKR